MPAFEYKVVPFLTDSPPPLIEEMLTAHGSRRWELVSVVPNPGQAISTRFYFKRAVAERDGASK